MTDSPESFTEDGEVLLELAKTRLRVVGRELQRANPDGTLVMRLPLANIEAVEYRRQIVPGSIVFMAVGGGLAAIGYYLAENNVLMCILIALGLLLAAFGLLGITERRIFIKSRDNTISIANNDLADEGEGFVTSLRQLIM